MELLKTLEQIAYDGTNHAMMQHYTSWEDVADYCDCSLEELKVYLTDSWYILLAEHPDFVELVDFASKRENTPIFNVITVLTQYQKPFIMDCRESTSYRIVKSLEQAGRISVLLDEAYERDGEVFHDIRLELCEKKTLKL